MADTPAQASSWHRISEKRFAHALPIVYEGGPAPVALLIAAFGAIFGVLPIVAASVVLIQRGPSVLPVLGMIPFVLFGGAFFWLGLKSYFRRESFVITSSSVSYKLKELGSFTQWEEPLSSYRGVLGQEVYHQSSGSDSSGSSSDSYTEYRVVLKHSRSAAKDIEFFNARVSKDLEAEVEGLSKLLGVAVLRENPDGTFAARQPGELEKSLADRAREGKVAPPFDADRPLPGKSLRREQGPEGEVLVGPLGGRAAGAIGAAIIIFGAIWLCAAAKSVAMMGIFSFLFGAIFLALGLAEEALTLTASELRQEYRLLGYVLRGTSVTRSGINDVFIFRQQGSSREVVRITTKGGDQIDAGQSISPEERLWLKDHLLARLER